jgi:hypothetical protein
MATSSAGLAAAYSTEINSCSFNADAGPRTRSRPQQFCDAVTLDSTLAVAGAATFASATTFAMPITVQGFVFTPQLYLGVYVLATGPLTVIPPTPPTPPPTIFDNITVNGTATIANAVMDAGSY